MVIKPLSTPENGLQVKLDRSAFSTGTLDEQTPEYVASWRARPYEERISAVQFMRTVMYGQDAASGQHSSLVVRKV